MHKALLIICSCAFALAQDLPTGANSQPPTFQSKVKEVLVPVVVRDRHGMAIGNLSKDDFQLFDKGKAQQISSFVALKSSNPAHESANGREPVASSPPNRAIAAVKPRPTLDGSSAPSSPERHFLYLFDDLNITFPDLARVRAAAASHFKGHFVAGDRASVHSVSGRVALDATDDPQKLRAAVETLRWSPPAGRGEFRCPDVSMYIADLVVVKADEEALQGLTKHTMDCAHVRPELARQLALGASHQELALGRQDTQLMLSALRRAIRRLAGLPGQRIIVLASPGFFAQTPEAIRSMAEVLELAAENGVTINSLSVRGVILAPEEMNVAEQRGDGRRVLPGMMTSGNAWARYRRESARADEEVMRDLAEGTGGSFFHNNNELRAGFARLTASPEYSYVLGFSPASDTKADGSFHALKIQLANLKGVQIEARRGYYALEADERGAKADGDLEDAIFSRNERSDFPVVLQTGYSRPNNSDAVKAYVVAGIDRSALDRMGKPGRGHESVDVAVALFDANGAYVTNIAERVSLEPPTTDIAMKAAATTTLRWEFPGIKPGNYLVRFVIREPKSKAVTMINRTLTAR